MGYAWLLPIGILIVFEFIADIFAEEYALKGHALFWIAVLSCYVIANVFWLWGIRSGSGLARGAVIFSVGSALLAVMLGILVFHEHVSKVNMIGMGLGLISLLLILWI